MKTPKSLTRILPASTFTTFAAELTSDNAETTNVVHKYAAMLQVLHVFQSLADAPQAKEAWLSITRGLQYIVQTIEDYGEDDSYSWDQLDMPNHLSYLHFAPEFQKTSNLFFRDFSTTEVDTPPDLYFDELVSFYVDHCQGGYATTCYMNLCHNYMEVILDHNSECGLTAIGNSILSLLSVPQDLDYPNFLPDVECNLIADGFEEFDLSDTQMEEEDFFAQEKVEPKYEDSLRNLLASSMDEAVILAARKLLKHEMYDDTPKPKELGIELAVQILVHQLIADESVTGYTQEEYMESVTEDIIDFEEELGREQREALAELESRCHENFIVTLIETLRTRKCEPMTMYGFPEWRMTEITDGNKLPIYPEFYTNVANILSTLLSVPSSQIRMVLEPDSFMFTYMDRDADVVVL